jgi:anti-sigma B factor antagonist
MNCSAAVRRVGDVAIVDLNGKFTISDAPGLIRGTVSTILDSGTRRILINVSQVTYLDSAAGIGELVSSYTSTVHRGGQLKLLKPDKRITYILHLLRLDTVFEIYQDENEAVRSF